MFTYLNPLNHRWTLILVQLKFVPCYYVLFLNLWYNQDVTDKLEIQLFSLALERKPVKALSQWLMLPGEIALSKHEMI